MIDAARRAEIVLRHRKGNVAEFVRGCLHADGGFCNRNGESDPYYTVFGLGCMAALGGSISRPAVAAYLRRFGDGASLDLVHRASLARCWAHIGGQALEPAVRARLLKHLAEHRTPDGGYAEALGGRRGTVYGCFLALGVHQDLRAEIPDRPGMLALLDSRRMGDGGYANDASGPVSTTTVTAAAVCLLREMGASVATASIEWLRQRSAPEGGFCVSAGMPVPDLLSTATALHAWATCGGDTRAHRDASVAYVLSLWRERGGFAGHEDDQQPDVEHTFYALLALGHLAGSSSPGCRDAPAASPMRKT
jgi:prenyltransferase beta subunit